MTNSNPFTLSFGRKPLQYITRFVQINEVIESFESEVPTSPVYMITGVRGSGKTVLMSAIANDLREKETWIVIDLNSERKILDSAVAKLYDNQKVQHLFLKANMNLSMFGIGASIESERPILDIESALELMLKEVEKQGKKVLITIDEVENNPSIREFVSSFQIMQRQNLPIYLIMTGLYDNIYNLQNEKTLTFLYRAPKITLEPLNLTAISKSYSATFDIPYTEAQQLATLTKGYPFAYQVLGYLLWENSAKNVDEFILEQYDQYLEEFVYEKIYSEITGNDKKFLLGVASKDTIKTSELLEITGLKKNEYTVYRDRLNKKGLINVDKRGFISMKLPRFSEYLMRMAEFE